MKTTKLLLIIAIIGCVVTQSDRNQLSNGGGFFNPSSIFGSGGFNIFGNEQGLLQQGNGQGNQQVIQQGNQSNQQVNQQQQQKQFRQQQQFQPQQQIQQVQPVQPSITFPAKKVQDNVAKAFDASTKKLTDFKAKLIKEIEDKYLTFGLSSSQRKAYQAKKTGQPLQVSQTKKVSVWDEDNTDDISDSNGDKEGNVKKFRGSRTDQVRSCKIILARIESDIEEHLTEFNKHIDTFFNKTQQSIRKLRNENSFSIFDDSKILKTDEFTERIRRFFDNQISEAKMIYSGSRDGFAALKFHQKCDNQINTLTIVKTATDKVFGGFAAIPWDSSSAHGSDDSKKSFVYQLNYNDKFSMVHPQYAIYKLPSYGPTFGGGHDFNIVDNSNASTSSYTNIGYTYTHSSYVYGSNQARVRFAGANNFKVVELQVWKLNFGEKCSK